MQTVEMKTLPKKNREKVSEMKTVEIPIFFLGGGYGSQQFSFEKPSPYWSPIIP